MTWEFVFSTLISLSGALAGVWVAFRIIIWRDSRASRASRALRVRRLERRRQRIWHEERITLMEQLRDEKERRYQELYERYDRLHGE